jgi:hypothetical protein
MRRRLSGASALSDHRQTETETVLAPVLHLTQTSPLHETWPSNTSGASPAIIMVKSATSVGGAAKTPCPAAQPELFAGWAGSFGRTVSVPSHDPRQRTSTVSCYPGISHHSFRHHPIDDPRWLVLDTRIGSRCCHEDGMPLPRQLTSTSGSPSVKQNGVEPRHMHRPVGTAGAGF